MIGLKSLFARAIVFSLGAISSPFVCSAKHGLPAAVYTLSNATDTNRVVVFTRSASGNLKPAGAFPTGGKGTGAALGSQGALAMSADGRWLLAVNAASNDISVFSVRSDALVLTDIAPSGGRRPISVAVADNLIYVLNAGGAADSIDLISGLYLSESGQLHPLPGSTQPLVGANVGPAQVSFGPSGDTLIVTEKTSNRIEGFAVDDYGLARSATMTASSGATPFGFAISSKGYLFVSEAPGSALSSYRLSATGTIDLVTGSRANQQVAACWVVLSSDEKYVYTANAGNNTISGYRVGADGSVALLSSTGITATTDDGPLDLASSSTGGFLYALNGKSRTIVGFRLGADGQLERIAAVGGLPAGMAGLVAR